MQGILHKHSPIMQTLDIAEKYGLYNTIIDALFQKDPPGYNEGKKNIKITVKAK